MWIKYLTRYNKPMPKSDEEIRNSIKKYEESLPDSERNPNAKEDIERLIVRAAQPLSSKPGKLRSSGSYTGRRTHSHTAEDTSEKRSDTSHQ